jgi:hypothetical protein
MLSAGKVFGEGWVVMRVCGCNSLGSCTGIWKAGLTSGGPFRGRLGFSRRTESDPLDGEGSPRSPWAGRRYSREERQGGF